MKKLYLVLVAIVAISGFLGSEAKAAMCKSRQDCTCSDFDSCKAKIADQTSVSGLSTELKRILTLAGQKISYVDPTGQEPTRSCPPGDDSKLETCRAKVAELVCNAYNGRSCNPAVAKKATAAPAPKTQGRTIVVLGLGNRALKK